jgi:hypothetical protein
MSGDNYDVRQLERKLDDADYEIRQLKDEVRRLEGALDQETSNRRDRCDELSEAIDSLEDRLAGGARQIGGDS